jgi:hypothetical protein
MHAIFTVATQILAKGKGVPLSSYSHAFQRLKVYPLSSYSLTDAFQRLKVYPLSSYSAAVKRFDRERRIQTLFQRFNGGTISIDEYLEAFKHQTGL